MARIVKASRAAADGPPVSAEWRAEASRLAAAAQAQAEEVIASARAEAARLREEAVREGRLRGLASAEEVLRRAEGDRQRILDEAEPEILRLALVVAGRVLEVAVEDPRAALETARKALERVRGRRELVLRAHPGDLPALRAALPDWIARLPGGTAPSLRVDREVGRGGVVVQTEAGEVDARIEAQLETLGRALAEAG